MERDLPSKNEKSDAPAPVHDCLSSVNIAEPIRSRNSNIAMAYVNTLSIAQLSDFLAWVLYFEIIELPDVPVSWFQYIDSMDMLG